MAGKPDKSQYLTTAEFARILGVSRVAALKRIKRLQKEELIRVSEFGKSFVVEKDSLPEDLKLLLEQRQKEAAERVIALGKNVKKDLNFEKELWKAADRLRGNIDPSEYKHVVLGLLFLKYVSDSFHQRFKELERRLSDLTDTEYYVPNENQRGAVLNDRDQYRSVGVFYIPEKARWDFLRAHAMHHNLGRYLDEAMDAIAQENPQLKGVLPTIYARTPLEVHILGELVNIFSRIEFDHEADQEKDILGRVYEYFLGQFASAEGKRGGEFYTPRSLVHLLVEILSPFENARVLDPACGSGGMFVQSREFLRMHQKDPNKLAFYGQESNPTTWKLCKMNLALRGIVGQVELGNSYYDDKFPDLRADFVLANPPFNAEWDPGRLSEKDPRLKYGTPPASSANFTWIQHFVHHLAPNGMAGFVMANGALAVGGRDGEIRKKIIDDDLVDVIVACPAKLFYNVSLPVSLWFLTRNKKNGRFRERAGQTLFIDARETFEQISRRQVTFTDEHIKKIANTVRAWRGEPSIEGVSAGQTRMVEYKDIPGFCKSVSLEEVRKNGYVLTPGRYVGVREEEDDGVPFEEKLSSLKGELKRNFMEARSLEDKIEENLKKLL